MGLGYIYTRILMRFEVQIRLHKMHVNADGYVKPPALCGFKRHHLNLLSLCWHAELLTRRKWTQHPVSRGRARPWGRCSASCWWCWWCVCWACCSTKERGGRGRSPLQPATARASHCLLVLCFWIAVSVLLFRALVIQKVSACCRRGNQVSYKYSKVGVHEGRNNGWSIHLDWDLFDPPTTSHLVMLIFDTPDKVFFHFNNFHITIKK